MITQWQLEHAYDNALLFIHTSALPLHIYTQHLVSPLHLASLSPFLRRSYTTELEVALLRAYLFPKIQLQSFQDLQDLPKFTVREIFSSPARNVPIQRATAS